MNVILGRSGSGGDLIFSTQRISRGQDLILPTQRISRGRDLILSTQTAMLKIFFALRAAGVVDNNLSEHLPV